jgi:UDP-N-acetylmuramoyl-L-alanyl-D-glutamate--2,6-diaminopimelate ligase
MELAAVVDALADEGLLVRAPTKVLSITAITDDSRKVEPGALFCAVRGTVHDAHRFLGEACERGAVGAVVEHQEEADLPQIVVRDSRTAAGVVARKWYGDPAQAMTLVGVTGTNGKTTTVALTRHLLNEQLNAGSLGTLGAFDGSGEKVAGYGLLTTPGALEFQAALADLAKREVKSVAIEASSHGLDQRRLDSIRFDAAVYTNLTREHLDYHPDLESYAAAKMRLSELVQPGGVEIVNADDQTWDAMPARSGLRRIKYGRSAEADASVVDEELYDTGAKWTLRLGDSRHQVTMPLLGEYNVTNALAAAATAWVLGVNPVTIAERLATVPQVPGRMERLVSGPFNVLRDYAHTPDGFERAIGTIRAITPGSLIVLFGAGGDRDSGKRAVMGSLAARFADLVVIASDNPRTEDPERILDDIEQGLEGAPHLRISDREEAICEAVSRLTPGDCLLLLGKGHETYQIYGHEKIPFDERAIVETAVKELV